MSNNATKTIPYGRQSISAEDIDAVVQVLQSDWLTQGPSIENFEKAIAQYCGVKHAVAVSNATAALHIACLAAGMGFEDWLWTSPNTFVASANCGKYCGSKVDFVDVDAKTYNMSVERLTEKLAQAAKTGRLPKVVIPVHFAGQSCDMEPIRALSEQYGFTVIEDASHAVGGDHRGTKIGDCKFSDMTVFSFHPVKIITTGEGGIITTNNDELYNKLVRLRSHGITRDARFMSDRAHGAWEYEQIELGFNYRMTDIQAALGTNQLKRIDEFVVRRRKLVSMYDEQLAPLPVILPYIAEKNSSAHHLYVIQIDDGAKKARTAVFDQLRSAGIGVNVHYMPVHLQPFYKQFGFNTGDFPQAEKYYSRAISLPMYFGLSEEDLSYVVNTLTGILS